MDQDEAGANRNAKKGRGEYPSILTHLFSNEDVEAIVTNNTGVVGSDSKVVVAYGEEA